MKHEIWYVTCPRLLSIREVAITRSTKNSVWELNPSLFEGQDDLERQQKRHSEHADYWPTLKEAAEAIRKQAEEVKDSALERLAEANQWLDEILQGRVRCRKFMMYPKRPKGEKIII